MSNDIWKMHDWPSKFMGACPECGRVYCGPPESKQCYTCYKKNIPVYCVYGHVMKDRSGPNGNWMEPCDKNGKLINAGDDTPIEVFKDKSKALKFSKKCNGYDHVIVHCGFVDGKTWRGFRSGEKKLI
jgi:hypothetical protein